MDAIQAAYLIYFTVLQGATLLWVYGYPVVCAGISLAVVCLHFVFGGWRISQSLQSTDRSLLEVLRGRYVNQLSNIIADFLLSYSLVILAVFLGLHPRPDSGYLTSGLLAAVVGNSFCVLGQVSSPIGGLVSSQVGGLVSSQVGGQVSSFASGPIGGGVAGSKAARLPGLRFYAM